MKRSELKRKTPMKRGGKRMARSNPKRKQPSQGFPDDVRVKARIRSKGICEAGSEVCTGTASHFHHRKLRRFKDHSLANCLHVCSACHTHIHANPQISYMMGWLLHEWQAVTERFPLKGSRWNEWHGSQR